MHYCLNCYHQNPDELQCCENCSTPLLLCDAFYLTRPLQDLNVIQNFRHPTAVFEAEDQHRGTFRVIKVLQSDRPDHRERFQRELAILEELEHPGIPCNVWTFAAPIAAGKSRQCLVMEKVEGENLRVWIKQHGAVSQAQAIEYLKQLLAIVALLHQNYWMHRDIKPENIIVRPNGQLVLVDFGTARSMTGTLIQKLKRGDGVTQVFSYGYSPLEQIGGCGDFRADFFALARTIVYALTGQEPAEFKQQEGRLLWRKAVKVSVGFADLLDAMMTREPDDRLTNVKQILWRLDHLPLTPVLELVRWKGCKWVAGVAIVVSLGLFSLIIPTITYAALFRHGETLLEKERYQEAEQVFRDALRHRQTMDVFNNLALACEKQQKWSCAAENYEEAMRRVEINVEEPLAIAILNYNVGLNFDRNKDFLQAEQYYRAAIAAGYDQSSVRNNLSRVLLLKLKQNDTWMQTIQEAKTLAEAGLIQVSLEPGHEAALLKNRGWANYLLENYQQAEMDLNAAIEGDRERPDAYYLLAQVYEATDRTQEARVYWQKGWEITSQLANFDDLIELVEWHNEAVPKIDHDR